ncbi:hypothetical protein KQI65_03720 [bacterium]|nr:hypothetical protein [bacterium]
MRAKGKIIILASGTAFLLLTLLGPPAEQQQFALAAGHHVAGAVRANKTIREHWDITGLRTPVRVIVGEFSGRREGRHVQLEWMTSREIGNQGFEVQRASSLSHGWEKLTFVPGFGSSTMEQTYYYTDRNAPPEDVRYMLRIRGEDGSVQYSRIISVPAGSMLRSFTLEQLQENRGKIFRATVELEEGGVTAISVIDGKGLTLLRVMAASRLEAGKHDFIVDCAKVPTGSYTLLLHTPEGRFKRTLHVP